jgi:hypothetical protein
MKEKEARERKIDEEIFTGSLPILEISGEQLDFSLSVRDFRRECRTKIVPSREVFDEILSEIDRVVKKDPVPQLWAGKILNATPDQYKQILANFDSELGGLVNRLNVISKLQSSYTRESLDFYFMPLKGVIKFPLKGIYGTEELYGQLEVDVGDTIMLYPIGPVSSTTSLLVPPEMVFEQVRVEIDHPVPELVVQSLLTEYVDKPKTFICTLKKYGMYTGEDENIVLKFPEEVPSSLKWLIRRLTNAIPLMDFIYEEGSHNIVTFFTPSKVYPRMRREHMVEFLTGFQTGKYIEINGLSQEQIHGILVKLFYSLGRSAAPVRDSFIDKLLGYMDMPE